MRNGNTDTFYCIFTFICESESGEIFSALTQSKVISLRPGQHRTLNHWLMQTVEKISRQGRVQNTNALAKVLLYTVFTLFRARICKRLRSQGIGSEESIPPADVAWRAGTTNRVALLAIQAGNRFLGSLKGLQIRPQDNGRSVLFNCPFRGREKKLLLYCNRHSFFGTLNRRLSNSFVHVIECHMMLTYSEKKVYIQ